MVKDMVGDYMIHQIKEITNRGCKFTFEILLSLQREKTNDYVGIVDLHRPCIIHEFFINLVNDTVETGGGRLSVHTRYKSTSMSRV